MKILVVPSWYPPFGGRFFRLQAEVLSLKGHKVDVLCLNEKGITQKINSKIDASKSEFLNEQIYTFNRIPKLNKFNRSRYIIKFEKLVKEYLEKETPDVIHIHSAIWAGIVVSKIAKEKNIPYIISEHRSSFLDNKLDYNQNLLNRINEAFLFAEKIIVVSSSMNNALKPYTDIDKIECVPNMLDTTFFKKLENIEKPKDFTFISVGNLLEVKGYDILISAFALLLKNNINIQLKIIGEGNNRNVLEKVVKDLNLENNVHFGGYKTKEELLTEYNKADAYVSSSRVESFGVSIIEAMACGLPIVVTKSGGPEDIVNDENGFLAEVNNASSLQFKMQLMLDKYSKFDSEIIRQNVINKYSKEIVASKIEKLLKECLQNSKP